MQISLDHCVIHVSERARSNAFYRDVLGATLVGDADGPAMYRFGRQQLNVHGPGLRPYPVARLPVQPGGSDLCFVWDGPIDGAVDHLHAHSVDVELGPVGRAGTERASTSATPTAACSNSSPITELAAQRPTGRHAKLVR